MIKGTPKNKLSKPIQIPKGKKWFISTVGKVVKASPMENKIAKILTELGIKYYQEISFKDLNPSGTKDGYFRFDFWIPSKKAVIEYDGEYSHTTPEQINRDCIKNAYCKLNKIRMIRLNKLDIPYFAILFSTLK